MLQASAIYYKTNLAVHNFPVFDLVSEDIHYYLWNEIKEGLEESVFPAIIMEHLNDYLQRPPSNETLTLQSDSCGYQQCKNIVTNALYRFSCEKSIIIIQTFLKKRHTQTDSGHSLIKHKLKNRDIKLPSNYTHGGKTIHIFASKPNPNNLFMYLSFDFSLFAITIQFGFKKKLMT